MNSSLTVLSFLKIAVLFTAFAITFDYAKIKMRYLVYVSWLAFSLVLNEVFHFLSFGYGYFGTSTVGLFYATTTRYFVLLLIAFSFAAFLVKWALSEDRAKTFLRLHTPIVAILLIVTLGVTIVLPGMCNRVGFLDKHKKQAGIALPSGKTLDAVPLAHVKMEKGVPTYRHDEVIVSFVKGTKGRFTLYNVQGEVLLANVTLTRAYSLVETIVMLLLAVHAVIMLVSALMPLQTITPHSKENLGFLAENRTIVNVIYGAVAVGVLPLAWINHLAYLVAAVTLAFLSFRYRTYIYNVYYDTIEGRKREKTIILDLLYQISNSIAENKERSEIFELITSSAIRTTEARAGALFLVDPEDGMLVVQHVEGLFPPLFETNKYVREREERIRNKLLSDRIPVTHNSYLGLVAQEREPLLIKKAFNDERVLQTLPGFVSIDTLIATPLKMKDNLFGVLVVLNKEGDISFDENDLSLLGTLADQTAVSINNLHLYETIIDKEKSERDIAIAGEIQQNLLPTEAPGRGGDIHAFSFAAKGVGGDFYDYLDLGNGRLGAICVDVAGKGVPASLVMVMIRAVWRLAAPATMLPSEAVTRVNRGISGDLTAERYATLFYCIIDEEKKTMRYANAGHGPLLLYRAGKGEFEELDTEGIPVGIMMDSEYVDGETAVEKDDIAVMYTDGVTEAMTYDREQFGIERVKQCLMDYAPLSAKEICDKMYDDINVFVDGAPQHDDQTLVVIKIL